jgi:transposase-like protein
LIERSFLEERRRTKIIPRFFDERSCLKLVFAMLQRASQRWQRIRITELEQKQMEVLRQHWGWILILSPIDRTREKKEIPA